MLGLVWKRILLILLGLFLIGSVSTIEESSLYRTCEVTLGDDEPIIPAEQSTRDPAFFPEQTIALEYSPPTRVTDLGFTHLVGMFNLVTAYPCDRGKSATVEFRSIDILEQDSVTGETSVKQSIRFDEANWDRPNALDYFTYYREPWFTGGAPNLQSLIAALDAGIYTLNARFVPKGIIHGWTTPRVEAVAGKQYLIEAVVRVSGDARLQLGMDYWRGALSNYNGWSEGCLTSNNCQVWLSNWLGDTGGEFITWRVPFLEY